MNDLDRDLREMFRRREGDVLIPPTTPGPVLRRTRRRQIGTVLTAGVAALAVAVAAVAGATALRGSGTSEIPGVDPAEGMRTTTGPYATITYPAAWLATVDGTNLAITNFDPGLDGPMGCRIDAAMPHGGVALFVLPDLGEGPPVVDAPPWPVTLGPSETPVDSCVTHTIYREAAWTAPSGVAFRAYAFTGPSAGQTDIAALEAALATLTFPADDRPAIDPTSTERRGAPGLVLESGVTGGIPWNLVAFLAEEQSAEGQAGVGCVRCSAIMLEVERPGAPSSGAMQVPLDPPGPDRLDTTSTRITGGVGAEKQVILGAVVYGSVGDLVASAETLGTGAEVVRTPARIFTAPRSLGITARLVVGSVEGEVDSASAVGSLADGTELPAAPQKTGDTEVIGHGTDPLAGRWKVTVTPTDSGAALAIERGSGSGSGAGIGPLEGALFGGWMVGGGREAGHLLGVVRADVDRLDVVFDDGTVVPATVLPIPERYVGPAKIFLAFVPVERIGPDLAPQAELVAYDAEGTELGREPTSREEPAGPTPEIDAAWNLLERARDELVRFGAKQPFDELRIVATIDSNIDYLVSGDPPHGRPEVGGVTVRVDDDRHLVALTRAETGEVFCVGVEIADGGGAAVRYGSLNAVTYQECTGGWA